MSLPSSQPELPLEQFYGLSPGSLARGANWTDYQGHVFWDMETWMYPPILVLFPDLARDMLSYRIYGGKGARAKAREHGYEVKICLCFFSLTIRLFCLSVFFFQFVLR